MKYFKFIIFFALTIVLILPVKAFGAFGSMETRTNSMDYGVKSQPAPAIGITVIPTQEQINAEYKNNESPKKDLLEEANEIKNWLEENGQKIKNADKSYFSLVIFFTAVITVIIIFIFLKRKNVI